MNNVEIEDFYHHDFTTATEWEVFIARLEEIMNEWKISDKRNGPPLKSGDLVNCQWETKVEKLHFADVEFSFKHFRLNLESEENAESPLEDEDDEKTECQKDMLNPSNDFACQYKEHLDIALYFGIREFLVLVSGKGHAIIDETRMKILLSSVTIAANNTNSEVPIFVQVQELWQEMYLGTSVGRGSCVNFEMVHLKKVPPHCKYLTGLLALLKQKITEGCGVRLDPVLVSVRFSYLLNDWSGSNWTQEPPDFDFMQGETLGVAELGKLPFGTILDPVGELHLYTTWQQISENVVVDSEGFTDFEPQLAPEWSVQVTMFPSSGLLADYLANFLLLCNSKKALADLLDGSPIRYLTSGSAFSILSEPKIPTISSSIGKDRRKKRKNVEGPISEEVLMSILYFLFPDTEDDPKTPYSDTSTYYDEEQWKGVKTCVIDSLVWRLAVVAAHCTHSLGGDAALAQLWYEFVQEIRFRRESDILIPGVASGFPDTVRTCLLHQKLQMMNCCIERKKSREESVNRSQSVEYEDFETESEEEEFFECTNEVQADNNDTATNPQIKAKHLLWNKPAGRLTKHPSLRLLRTGDPLYLPVVQEPVPKTEDQLEEDAQIMMQLGTDKYASEMRARMMSASLLSDMESFKAANPGAILEDFIRWYSPRDWIEDNGRNEWGQPNGHLSPRMLIPGNAWSTTWASAQPVPAHRQKRLFDDTREAEKVLHFLSSRRLEQVAQLLLPVLAHAALYTAVLRKSEAAPNFPGVSQTTLNKLHYLTKSVDQNLKLYEEIIWYIDTAEAFVAQVNSLQLKLGGDDSSEEFTTFLMKLMEEKEVSVPGGPRGNIGVRITTMFRDAQKAADMMTSVGTSHELDAGGDSKYKSFPEPSSKQFILRAITPRPSISSTPQPQRMYACLKGNSIRLAGSFSEDTVFV